VAEHLERAEPDLLRSMLSSFSAGMGVASSDVSLLILFSPLLIWLGGLG
jgi:hypothetical protein